MAPFQMGEINAWPFSDHSPSIKYKNRRIKKAERGKGKFPGGDTVPGTYRRVPYEYSVL